MAEKASISDTEFLILQALAGNLRRGYYGSDLQKEIRDATGRRVQLGTIYVLLGRLAKRGFVERTEPEATDDLRRQFYRLTSSGAQAARTKEAAIQALVPASWSRS